MGKQEKRENTKKRWIITAAIAVPLLCIGLFLLAANWEAIGYMRDPEGITLIPVSEHQKILDEGNYEIEYQDESSSLFTSGDGAVALGVTYNGDKIDTVSAEFNAHSVPVYGMTGAVDYAKESLRPFFTEPGIDALAVIAANEIVSSVSNDMVEYSRNFGTFTVDATSNSKGDVSVQIVNR